MDIETLTRFFLWCTIIDGVLLIVWSFSWLFCPEWVYRTQKRWFPLGRETFNLVMYCFIGLFKILFLLFNLVPYIALRIVGN